MPAPVKKIKSAVVSNRVPGMLLRFVGGAASVGGAVAVVVGSVLPWLHVPLFGADIPVPGLLIWGGLTLALGLLTLASLLRRRFLPWVSLGAGLLCIVLGWQAKDTVGQTAKRYALETQMRLAPVNARLEQINVAPIEPFGETVGAADRFVGPGPLWVVYGGIALTAGGLVQVGGERWGRTCARCHRPWRVGRHINFCPHCGTGARVFRACPVCYAEMEKRDRFCVNCGTNDPGS